MDGSGLTGREFEELCNERGYALHNQGAVDMNRYGVMANYKGFSNGKPDIQVLRSLPDFEGVLPPSGRQFIFDCKVCSQSSFDLRPYQEDGDRRRQLLHLLDREEYGCITFLFFHLNDRELKTKNDIRATVALPVSRRMRVWHESETKARPRLSRQEIIDLGVSVEWDKPGLDRKDRPDLYGAIMGVSKYLEELNRVDAGGNTFHPSIAGQRMY